MRAEAEDQYGQKLGDIEAATNRIDGGFQRDDGASLKKVRTYNDGREGYADKDRHTRACARKWVRLPGITER